MKMLSGKQHYSRLHPPHYSRVAGRQYSRLCPRQEQNIHPVFRRRMKHARRDYEWYLEQRKWTREWNNGTRATLDGLRNCLLAVLFAFAVVFCVFRIADFCGLVKGRVNR